MKGAAANLSANALAGAAFALEQLGRENALGRVASALDAVERETLSLEQAQLLYATSVAGIPAVGAAALIGLPRSRGVYHALAKAEAAFAASPA